MVNEIMMKKKQYLFPVVEVLPYSFPDLMKVGDGSGTATELPPDPAPAVRRGTQML